MKPSKTVLHGLSFTAAFTGLTFGLTAYAQPARPAAQPARPAAQPARPAAQPARPAARPAAQPARPAAQPAAQPAAPAAQPAAPAASTTAPAAAAVAQGVAAVVTAQPASSDTLRLAVSAELNGRVATAVCGDAAEPAPVTALAAELAGEPDALALDAGDLVGSSAMGRFAASHDANALAAAAAAMGLRATALGHRDLAMPRDQFVSVATALAARHIPYVLTNLVCDGGARALCDHITDSADAPLILDTPQGRVAYLAVLGPTALRYVARDRAAGVTLQPVAEAIARGTQAARAAGARWVVVAHDPDGPDVEETALAVARELPAEGRPDVMLVNGASDFISSMEAARSGVSVVMTRPGHALAVSLGSGRLAREARQGAVPADVTALSTGTRDWLCQTQNTPLRGGRLTAPLDRDAFGTFLLNVMRDETETEVAIMNRGAVQGREIFPLSGALTGLHLATALPFDDRIYVGRVKGSVLAAMATSARAGRFIMRGITTDGGVKINGRAVEPDTMYRVVTTGFVYDGGEGGFDATDGVELAVFGSQGPREFMAVWLDRAHDGDITQIPVDPSRRVRWTFNAGVNLGFNFVTTANPIGGVAAGAGYTDSPQLSRTDTRALRGEASFRANAHHPNWSLNNALNAQYGRASVGNSAPFAENLDIINLRSSFAYTGLTANPEPYIPAPDLELFAESEFDGPPADAMGNVPRDFHHLQLRLTGGARFTLLPTLLTARLGAGMDWKEVFADPSQDPSYVFLANVDLQPITLFSIRGQAVKFDALAEFAVRQAFSEALTGSVARDGTLRVGSHLTVPIYSALSITAAYNLFGRLARSNEVAFSHDMTLSLGWTWGRAVQTYR